MRCSYCLCRVCNKVRCPRGKYHCIPCYHGTILECDFFMHRQVTKVYRIKKRSPAIRVDDLEKLRDTINLILGTGDGQIDLIHYSLKSSLDAEEQRHRRALKEILEHFKSNE